MNIDRALPQLGIGAASGDARGSSSQAEGPAFSLDVASQGSAHETGPSSSAARDAARADAATQAARVRASAQAARERAQARAAQDAPRDKAPVEQQEAAAKPETAGGSRDVAKADARREHAVLETHDDVVAEDGKTPDGAAVASSDAHEQTKDTADAALPDRMLALLSGEWAPPTATPRGDIGIAGAPGVPVSTTTVMLPGAIAAATDAIASAAQAPLTPADPSLSTTPIAAATAGAGPAALTALPTAPANADAGPAEAFAALAALADGKGERTTAAHAGAADATAPSAPGLAFNALAARGADALQTVTRAVAMTGPTSIPLALDAAFDDGMGSRILWMADQRVDRAEIRLNPDSLGPIDVRLQMDGHRLNAQFHSANADVRQALESGMDRLRDMLGRQGMELGQAQVGAGSRQSGDGRHPASTSHSTDEVATGEPAVTTVRTLRSRGLLDEYA